MNTFKGVDYYNIESLLSSEEKMIRDTVREFVSDEVIPIIDGKLGLGTWQSVLFFDLDGPRKRTLLVQISGE